MRTPYGIGLRRVKLVGLDPQMIAGKYLNEFT